MDLWWRALQGHGNFNNAVRLLGVAGSLLSLTAPLLGRILFKWGVRIYGEKANFRVSSRGGSVDSHCVPGFPNRLEKISIKPNKTSLSFGQLTELHCIQNVLLCFLIDSAFVDNYFVAESKTTNWTIIVFWWFSSPARKIPSCINVKTKTTQLLPNILLFARSNIKTSINKTRHFLIFMDYTIEKFLRFRSLQTCTQDQSRWSARAVEPRLQGLFWRWNPKWRLALRPSWSGWRDFLGFWK